MPTLDKEIADRIVKANGRLYAEDPPCTRIVEYTNKWGGTSYGVTFEGQNPDTYTQPSQFIINPKIYWEAAS